MSKKLLVSIFVIVVVSISSVAFAQSRPTVAQDIPCELPWTTTLGYWIRVQSNFNDNIASNLFFMIKIDTDRWTDPEGKVHMRDEIVPATMHYRGDFTCYVMYGLENGGYTIFNQTGREMSVKDIRFYIKTVDQEVRESQIYVTSDGKWHLQIIPGQELDRNVWETFLTKKGYAEHDIEEIWQIVQKLKPYQVFELPAHGQ